MTQSTKALLILDGFGLESTPSSAIDAAHTPHLDALMAHNPISPIATSGMAVGLPEGQMGNSEVGHMNIGAGRPVYQNYTRIEKAIADGDFFSNPVLTNAMDDVIAKQSALHILGLLSPGGVHSHEEHIFALIEMAVKRGIKQVYLHAILDGRDTPPRSAKASLEKAQQLFTRLGTGRIVTIVGRYYAMDRDNRWNRVQLAYDAMTSGEVEYSADTALSALEAAYVRDENDEFIKPTHLLDTSADSAAQDATARPKTGLINDQDAIIFANFRPDRARELTQVFIEGASFTGFQRQKHPQVCAFVMMTEYAADFNASCAYPPTAIQNDIGAYLSSLGKTQLRIAETEKYAHVTFFFNGGQEAVYPGEERILIPSPNVATYDLKPEMSAYEVTAKLVEAIKSRRFDLIVCNFANGDMVGHTGKFDAAVKAVEVLDECVHQVLEAMRSVEGETLISADHGNVEMMVNPKTGQPHTSHTIGPVPLIYDGPRKDVLQLQPGALCDLAPTLLDLMDIPAPVEMTGRSLIAWKH